MSTISTFSCSIYNKTNTSIISPKPHSSSFVTTLHFQSNPFSTLKSSPFIFTHKSKLTSLRSSSPQIPENGVIEEEVGVEPTETVTIPVSPADKLIMFFQAEGTMNELAIPSVTQSLEGTDGISDLKVLISEGIATVELTKQTTIQATGVASGLLEAIQGAGFKLNTLNLSFEDAESLPA